MAICYFRLVYTVYLKQGYVPLGRPTPGTMTNFIEDPQTPVRRCCVQTTVSDASKHHEAAERAEEKKHRRTQKAVSKPVGSSVTVLDYEAIFKGNVAPPPGLEGYYSRDVFQCDHQGLPIWCGHCVTWKPTRAHHCSDVGRCIMNLDHFCPW